MRPGGGGAGGSKTMRAPRAGRWGQDGKELGGGVERGQGGKEFNAFVGEKEVNLIKIKCSCRNGVGGSNGSDVGHHVVTGMPLPVVDGNLRPRPNGVLMETCHI